MLSRIAIAIASFAMVVGGAFGVATLNSKNQTKPAYAEKTQYKRCLHHKPLKEGCYVRGTDSSLIFPRTVYEPVYYLYHDSKPP